MSSFITSPLTSIPIELTDFTFHDFYGNCIRELISTVQLPSCGGRNEISVFQNSALFSWDFLKKKCFNCYLIQIRVLREKSEIINTTI